MFVEDNNPTYKWTEDFDKKFPEMLPFEPYDMRIEIKQFISNLLDNQKKQFNLKIEKIRKEWNDTDFSWENKMLKKIFNEAVAENEKLAWSRIIKILNKVLDELKYED